MLLNTKLLFLILPLYLLCNNIVSSQENDAQIETNNNEQIQGGNFDEQDNAEIDSGLNETDSTASNATLDVADTTSNTTVTKQRVNCIPVYRDETNKTGKIIVLNHSNLGDYLQLTNLPFNGAKVDVENGSSESSTSSPPGEETNSSDSVEHDYSVNMLANDSAKAEPGECSVIIFYLPTCPFSVAASPHFHAMARLYPQLNVLAIDAYGLYGATIRFGVVGVPSVYFYHKSRLVSRFSKAEPRLINLAEYFKNLADLEPADELEVTAEDETSGPLPLEVETSTNWLYYAALAFIALVVIYKFALSELCKNTLSFVRNKWTALLFYHEHLE